MYFNSFNWAKVIVIVFSFVFAWAPQCFAQVTRPLSKDGSQQIRASEDVLIGKLSRKEQVSEQEILNATKSWINYERGRNEKMTIEQEKNFDETHRFINVVLPLIKNDFNSTIQLKLWDADLLAERRKPNEAISSYQDALSDIEGIKYDIDYKYQKALKALGAAYVSAGQKSEADLTFSKASSYPWYSAPEPYFQDFRALYEDSVRALISVRRHDRNALERIYLPPAFQKELGPALADALNEAGGP